MASEAKLFDLFGEFTARWPSAVQRLVGVLGPGSDDPNLAVWLAALNSGTQVKNARVGAASDRVALEAQLTFDNAQATYAGVPDAFPFVLASMPDVEFRIQTLVAPKFVQFFASASDRGVELVLEGLPVEIRLPSGLIQPPDLDPAEVSVGSVQPGNPGRPARRLPPLPADLGVRPRPPADDRGQRVRHPPRRPDQLRHPPRRPDQLRQVPPLGPARQGAARPQLDPVAGARAPEQ
jgi:hypothetical protein